MDQDGQSIECGVHEQSVTGLELATLGEFK
jgi:hypothetical protein